jgi:hypothetical protein
VLNYLQGKYTERVHSGEFSALPRLLSMQRDIVDYYKELSEKIIIEGKAGEAEESE